MSIVFNKFDHFVTLPPVPGSLLAQGFRRAVLDFLVKNEALSEPFRSRMQKKMRSYLVL